MAMEWDQLIFDIGAFLTGLFMLEYGADKFVDHTAIVARRLGVVQGLVALLTAGAEWEELAVVISAVVRHRSSLALGNVVGSTISNVLGAFSLALLSQPGRMSFDRSSKIYTAVLLLVTTVFTLLALFKTFNRAVGGVAVAAFGVYVVSIGVAIYRGTLTAPELSDDEDSSDSDADSVGRPDGALAQDARSESAPLLAPSAAREHGRSHRSLTFHVVQVVLGFIALSISGYVLAHSASSISDLLGLSGTVVGVTILSFATTLPEKFVAVIGGARGHAGIVVANTVGSNIFLLTLCLGVVLLGGEGVELAQDLDVFELAVVWGSAVVLFAVVMLGASRWVGAGLLIGYVAFLVLEFTLYRR